MRNVFFERRKVAINNLPKGFYLVKLRSHKSHVVPRIEKEEIIDFITKKSWQELDIEVSQANFPYAHIYEPKEIKITDLESIGDKT